MPLRIEQATIVARVAADATVWIEYPQVVVASTLTRQIIDRADNLQCGTATTPSAEEFTYGYIWFLR